MGEDKSMVLLDGRPLIEHAIRILQGAGLAVTIAGGDNNQLKNFAPVVNDLGTSEGPLGGICGALKVTSVTWTVFVPLDLPMLPSALLTSLQKVAYVTGHQIVVPSVNGFTQTFPAVIHKSALPALQAELEAGHRGCFSAFQAAARALGKQVHVVAAEFLVQTGQVVHPELLPAARWFANINSPSDLARASSFRHRITT